jgi:hypothetical protein
MSSHYKCSNTSSRDKTDDDDLDKILKSLQNLRVGPTSKNSVVKKEDDSLLRAVAQVPAVQQKENSGNHIPLSSFSYRTNKKVIIQPQKQNQNYPSSNNKASSFFSNKSEAALPQCAAKKTQTYTCDGCSRGLKTLSSKFVYSNDDDVAYECDCGEVVCCTDCSDDVGKFCAGYCRRFYCYECSPQFIGAEGSDQFCGIECAKIDPSVHQKNKNHRRSYRESGSAEDSDDDGFDSDDY